MQTVPNAQACVLVVEDEAFVRMLAVEALEQDGFEVIEAGCAAEALALVSEGAAVDVLFTDVRMPGEPDGVELAERVCTTLPHCRVVVASGHALPTGLLPCEGRFFRKPYSLAEVTAEIHRLLGRPH